MVITGLTRNQLYLTVPWVRIPPSPPKQNAFGRFLFWRKETAGFEGDRAEQSEVKTVLWTVFRESVEETNSGEIHRIKRRRGDIPSKTYTVSAKTKTPSGVFCFGEKRRWDSKATVPSKAR